MAAGCVFRGTLDKKKMGADHYLVRRKSGSIGSFVRAPGPSGARLASHSLVSVCTPATASPSSRLQRPIRYRLTTPFLAVTLLAATASGQFLKSYPAAAPIEPQTQTALVTLTAPSRGVYLVTGQVALLYGWTGAPLVLDVTADRFVREHLCTATAPFVSEGDGPLVGAVSCTGQMFMDAGQEVVLRVRHEAGSAVTVDSERTYLALLVVSASRQPTGRTTDARN